MFSLSPSKALARRCSAGLALGLVCLAMLVEAAFGSEPWLPSSGPARLYAERALRTQAFVVERLAHFAGGDRCGTSAFLSFRREVGSPLSDAWYAASQLLADTAIGRLGQRSAACNQSRNVAFLDLLARPLTTGGYFPRANVDGQQVTTRDTFADDNALLGLAFLDARAASTDQAWRAELLGRATSAATYLTESGLWDDTFGGGFWWNSGRGRAPEGKPAQTTALAAQLFARLYQETGDRSFAAWAQVSVDWLDSRLLDPGSGLYHYALRWWDPVAQNRPYLDPRYFSYDQGIILEVHLLFDQTVEPRGGHLARARDLAERIQAGFWVAERGGYRLETGLDDVYTAYSAWLSQSLLLLYDADPRPVYLERAQANLDALDAYLLDPADNGYLHMSHRCLRREESGCESGAVWINDPTKLLFSQSWMQRAQALLAERLQRAGAGG